MLTRLVIIFSLAVSVPLVAAPDLGHPLTLVELVDIALANNPETRQAWWNAQRATAAVGVAKSSYYPKVAVDADFSHGRDFQFINGPDTTYTIVGGNLVLSMLLYDFGGRSAELNAAQAALLAADWTSNWTLQKVMVRVLENAYSALHFQESLQGARASLEDAQKMLDVALDMNRAGLRAISDVYTSQASLAQMQMDVAQQAALFDIQKGKLSNSMGLSADTPLQLAILDQLPAPTCEQLADLIALAQQQRSDLMAKHEKLSEAVASLNKAKAGFGPKISLTGRGGADHAFHDKTDAGHYRIAVNLEFPIFNGFETTYQTRMAFANTQIVSEELAQLELDIILEVLIQSRTLQSAQEMMAFAEENLNNTLKAYETMLEKYKAGKEGITAVSNAQRELAAARVRFSDVKTRWLISLANLAYSTGTLAPFTEVPCES